MFIWKLCRMMHTNHFSTFHGFNQYQSLLTSYQVVSNLILFSGISAEVAPQLIPAENTKFLPTILLSERDGIIREWDAIIFHSTFNGSRQG